LLFILFFFDFSSGDDVFNLVGDTDNDLLDLADDADTHRRSSSIATAAEAGSGSIANDDFELDEVNDRPLLELDTADRIELVDLEPFNAGLGDGGSGTSSC
jgi:hypothetical protein